MIRMLELWLKLVPHQTHYTVLNILYTEGLV